jgi:hypothetical protein
MKITADDYPSLKAFFAWTVENLMPPLPRLPADQHPLAVLERFEAGSMANARKGLAMAIGDTIEMTEPLSPADVATIDTALREKGIITLSEVRARFWTKIRRILERGALRGETDYYALRNVVEALPEQERAAGWRLLAAYEAKVTR